MTSNHQPKASAASAAAAHQDGPMESAAWPERLTARAVKPGGCPQLFGYALYDEVAPHLNFGETLYLAVSGEEPGEVVGLAFNVLLTFLANRNVGDAAVHSAVLSRLIGAQEVTAAATGFMVAAEGLRAEGLLSACRSAPGDGTHRLNEALQVVGAQEFLQDAGQPLVVSLNALGVQLGLDVDQMRLVGLVASLPAIVAETRAAQPLELKGYPSRLPEFVYRVDATDDD